MQQNTTRSVKQISPSERKIRPMYRTCLIGQSSKVEVGKDVHSNTNHPVQYFYKGTDNGVELWAQAYHVRLDWENMDREIKIIKLMLVKNQGALSWGDSPKRIIFEAVN